MDLDTLLLVGHSSPPVLKVLDEEGMPSRVYADLDTLIAALDKPGGVVVLARGLTAPEIGRLRLKLDDQPAWSDWPILVIGLEVSDDHVAPMLKALGNVLYLPSPFHPSAVLGAVRKGLRERARQYQGRDGPAGTFSKGEAKTSPDLKAAVEAQVQARTEELQRAIKALEGFCYTVAHDLRAPLRAMQGLATALVEDYAESLDGDGKDYAHRIVAAAARMDRLIQDLLAYSRLEQMDVALARVELEGVVDSVLMAMSREIKGAGADLRVRRPLPAAWSHPVVLEQVVSHLLSNALKFVAAGTKPQIEVRGEESADRVRLWVVDNGIGIDPRHHEKIFNIFERLHGEETYSGTGIGLALVRKGMIRIQGSSGVESHGGRGSRFWIELPKRAPASSRGEVT